MLLMNKYIVFRLRFLLSSKLSADLIEPYNGLQNGKFAIQKLLMYIVERISRRAGKMHLINRGNKKKSGAVLQDDEGMYLAAIIAEIWFHV